MLAPSNVRKLKHLFPLSLNFSSRPLYIHIHCRINKEEQVKVYLPLALIFSVCSYLSLSQSCPFDSKPQAHSGTQAKPSSPEAPASQTPPHEPQDLEQPGTPVPTEDPEAMETGRFNVSQSHADIDIFQ